MLKFNTFTSKVLTQVFFFLSSYSGGGKFNDVTLVDAHHDLVTCNLKYIYVLKLSCNRLHRSINQVMKQLGTQWSSLASEEKEIYLGRAKTLMELHQKDMEVYLQRRETETEAGTGMTPQSTLAQRSILCKTILSAPLFNILASTLHNILVSTMINLLVITLHNILVSTLFNILVSTLFNILVSTLLHKYTG